MKTQRIVFISFVHYYHIAEESKEQLNIQQFRLALEELEMETKALYEVNEKIMAAAMRNTSKKKWLPRESNPSNLN